MTKLMEALHFAKGLDPVADAFSGIINSDVVSMRDYQRLLFVIFVGVGATGTSTFTVEACDDAVPTYQTTIPFWSREITTGDTEGAVTRRAVAGFVNAAGSSKIVLIEVAAAAVQAARVNGAVGNHFVRLQAVESVDNPVLGGIMIIHGLGRYKEDVKATVTSP